MDIPIISVISCIMSRLSYFDNPNFLNKYSAIGNVTKMDEMYKKIKCKTTIFFKDSIKEEDLKEINMEVNKIIVKKGTHDDAVDKNVQFICISNSNYSSVYIVANKISNTIFVCFRGTYSAKSALSYSKTSSIVPFRTCSEKSDKGYLLGVFKIVSEIFYTIEESIRFLSTDFLKTNHYKLITTGHSLGGGMATIFSYLWVKHDTKERITCITFGSPSVMNGPLMKEYTGLMKTNTIQFRRYVTNGDPFASLPIKIKGVSEMRNYFHPDQYDDTFFNTSFVCQLNNTKKSVCNFMNKTKKRKKEFKYHGNYLGFSFKGAAQDLTNLKKEIKRNSLGQTICRIIVGGNIKENKNKNENKNENEKYKVAFFILDDAKKESTNVDIEKIEKLIYTDYKHQDIYMTTDAFNNILNKSTIIDNLIPLSSDNYIEINHSEKNLKPELYCL